MLIKQIMIGDPRIRSVRIGGLGEENATAIIFDCRKFVEWYGSAGTASVVVKRYGEDPYLPANQTYDSDSYTLTWTVDGADTSEDTTGIAEVRFIIDGELVAKTPLYNLEIRKNINDDATTPPEWYESYLNAMITISGTVQEDASDAADSASAAALSATNAAGSATSAGNSATAAANSASAAYDSASAAAQSASNASDSEDAAEDYMQSAQTYAGNASGSADNAAQSERNAAASETAASGYATNAYNSMTAAAASAERAAAAAEQTAYMFTSFDDETGLMTITLSDALAEDMTITPDYASGTLEVTIE